MISEVGLQVDGVRMSPQQRRYWSWYKETGSMPYHHIAVAVTGVFDRPVLQHAVESLYNTYPVLSTVFPERDGALFPLQITQRKYAPGLLELLLPAGMSPDEAKEKVAAMFEEKAATQARNGRCGYAAVIHSSTPGGDHMIHFLAEAIVMDSYSAGFLMHELCTLYNAEGNILLKGNLAEEVIPYQQFSEWQNSLVETPAEEAEEFWAQYKFEQGLNNEFFGRSTGDQLPEKVNYTRLLPLGVTLTRQLETLAEKTGKDLRELLLGALFATLYRHTKEDSLVIGYVNNERLYEELKGTLGPVGKTLPLYLELAENTTCQTLLENIAQSLTRVSSWEEYSSFGYNTSEYAAVAGEYFKVGFEWLSFPEAAGNGQLLHSWESAESFFGFKLNGVYANEELGIQASFSKKYLNAEEASLLLQQVIAALQQFVNAPQAALKDGVSLSRADEKVFNVLNTPQYELQSPADSVAALFSAVAGINADATAVGWEDKTMSYQQLDAYACRLANMLQRRYSIAKGDTVAVCIERSPMMIVAILGIIRAGAVYLPLDLSFPGERKQFMLEDSNARLLITGETTPVAEEIPLLRLDEELQVLKGFNEDVASVTIAPADPLYLIYTSGSTGRPKGVQVSHGSLLHYVNWFKSAYQIGTGDATLFFSSVAFDLGYTAFWGSLLSGAGLYLLPERQTLNPDELTDALTRYPVTFIKLTPSHFDLLVNDPGFDKQVKQYTLRLILLGGEEIRTQHLEKYFAHRPDVTFVNHYGPTEATIGAIARTITYNNFDTFRKRPVIGRPLGTNKIRLLQEGADIQVPVGAIGEICIAGKGVAIGYLNNPELTAKKFTADPLLPGNRLYRTGDLGRLLPSGEIEFLGRLDFQVKIRGYRVETGEIADYLRQFPGIRDVAVIAATDEQGDKYLTAYFVSEAKTDKAALDEFLKQQLPSWSIPAYYVNMLALPLTPNGKINRAELPDPRKVALKQQTAYVAPRNELEAGIARIWEEVLQKPRISINDNFFDLGGHSIKGIRIISRLFKELNVKLEIRHLFEALTISGLAELIRQQRRTSFEKITPLPLQPDYELSHAQKRIWVLCKFEEIALAYNMPGNYVLENINRPALEKAVETLIKRHESLRTTFRIIAGTPRQVINAYEADRFAMQYFDESAAADKQAVTNKYLQEEGDTAFDLEKGPLIRTKLVQLDDSKYLVIFNMHHIISDGWSMQVFVNDVLQLYNAYTAGAPNPLAPLKIHYKDFAAWQNKLLASPAITEHQQYWWKQFEGEAPVLNLPLDYPRPRIKSYSGRKMGISVDAALKGKLQVFAQQADASLFTVLLAAVKACFYRYTGQTDIVIGVPNAGREHLDLEDQIGFYVNSIPVRTQFSGNQSFRSLLEKVKTSLLSGFEHQVYPFDRLVDDLNLDRDMSRSPLFDVMVQLKNYQFGDKEINHDVNVDEEIFEMNTSQFDLCIDFADTDDGLVGFIEYNTDLFLPSTVEMLWEHLTNFMQEIADNPEKSLSELQLINEAGKARLLERGGVTRYASAAGYQHVLEHFDQYLRERPDATAVEFEGQVLTYRQLDLAAEKVAAFIKAQQSTAGDQQPVVAVLMDKRPEMISAVLGIMKAGAVCLPLEPSHPQARLQFVVQDAGAFAILSEKKYLHTLNKLQWECDALSTFLCMDTDDIYEVAHEWDEVRNEQEVWDYVGENSHDDISGGGWTSSYTGKELSREEMDEYAENVLIKLRPYLNENSRVLEIGCSSGISMFKMASLVDQYFGVDLSEKIIQKTRAEARRKGYNNITLQAAAAHEIDNLHWSGFDIIVINSVVQSFHGHNYLRQVISKCLPLLKNKGLIFFGDIQDQDLKQTLIDDLTAFRAANKDQGYFTKVDWSYELFLSRKFFEDLRYEYPAVIAVSHSTKTGTIANELTRYRFDCIVSVDKGQTDTAPADERHKSQFGAAALDQYEIIKGNEWYKGSDVAEKLAYIIYTSGTTGLPKGVMIPYKGLNNLVMSYRNDYRFSAFAPCLLQTASIAFDVFFADICRTLFMGGRLVLCNNDVAIDPPKLYAQLKATGVNLLDSTPSLIIPFMDYVYENGLDVDFLRVLILGSDSCPAGDFKKLYERYGQRLRILNCYGTTETTIEASFFEATVDNLPESGTTPIGQAISNVTYYVLDEYGQLVPDGVQGVLHIGGEGVAAGYINRPELNRVRFIPDPFIKGNTMFNTGDVVSWNKEGQIAFNGRNDYQVKIRGFRVELGEIESQLLQVEHVTQAAVLAHRDEDGANMLVAYYAAAVPLQPQDLKKQLYAKLPEYMVPAHLYALDSLPLTANGKLDRKTLLQLSPATSKATQEGPRNRLEQKLCKIWADVLGREGGIGINENFFDIGGHSLKATRVITRIYKDLGINLELRNIFLHPTIESLAKEITASNNLCYYEEIPVAQSAAFYEITPAQMQMWTMHHLDGQQVIYNMPAAYRISGAFDIEAMAYAFEALATRHEVLRTTFHVVDKKVYQKIHPADNWKQWLEVTDLTAAPDKTAAADEKAAADARIPFDLENGPLFRAKLFQLDTEEFLLLINIHHIISDGWSHTVMVNDLLHFYRSYWQIDTPELPPLRIQFKDYATMLSQQMDEKSKQLHRDFWTAQFGDYNTVLNLPIEGKRDDNRSLEAEKVFFTLNKPAQESLLKLGREHQSTLYGVLLSIYNVLIRHVTGQDDIVTGSPISGRDYVELENQLGMYLNVLALRLQVKDTEAFATLLEKAAKTVLEAQQYKRYPFEQILQDIRYKRQPGRAPLFDIGFTLQNIDGMENGEAIEIIDQLNIAEYNNNFRKVKTDLWLHAWEMEDGIGCSVTYNKQLYRAATIDAFVKDFQMLATLIAEDHTINVGRLLEELQNARKKADMLAKDQTKTKNIEKFFSAKKKEINLGNTARVVEEKLPGDTPYPLVLKPGMQDVDLTQWIKENNATVKQQLLEQGALLFRGFRVQSLKDFEQFCDGLDAQKMLYKDQSSPRTQVQNKLYTSTEHPADQVIHMHNELSYSHTWPQYILFFCTEAAATGGETPIADARKMLEVLSPETVSRFTEKNIRYIRNLKKGMGLSWQEVYQTDDPQVVEQHCKENNIDYTWVSDDHLRVSWERPAIRLHPVTGKPVWFNHGLFFNAFTLNESILQLARDENDLPFNTAYGDGTPIEKAVLEELSQAYEICKRQFSWQPGDILLLDNMLMSHGRNAFSGNRKLYVSMLNPLS
ncbi:amino acid adenylation domain-containing protein [Chitinophaga sp. YR627]|uniref:non-ribosomal peptide synthetase n=1 Tax=Chitinophaga sp. YR627 TaxID=1881041 RepID=UPI0008DF770A|nr:non-ribosomal peptide synthetase [Chitinophaga sp. YR627]SFO73627.1 amino acid adenylation domain-containing protein [Chitinophaga sp. YR627]